jgi:hypothetical protein
VQDFLAVDRRGQEWPDPIEGLAWSRDAKRLSSNFTPKRGRATQPAPPTPRYIVSVTRVGKSGRPSDLLPSHGARSHRRAREYEHGDDERCAVDGTVA